ncbi:MAG: hypothetical protein ACI30I_02335 [Parabacteroides sp.]
MKLYGYRGFISPLAILRGKEMDAESALQLDNKPETTFDQLLSLPEGDSLYHFITDYAFSHPDFHADVTQWIKSTYLVPSEGADDFTEEVLRTFDLSRYDAHDLEFGETVWDSVFSRVEKLLDKAVILLKFDRPDETLQIVQTILLMIAERYEKAYTENPYVDINGCCEKTALLLILAVQHSSITEKDKQETLKCLRQLKKYTWLEGFGLLDTHELLVQVQLLTQTPDQAIHLLDDMLHEYRNSCRLSELVIWKRSILLAEGKQKEVDKLLKKYVHLPEIRQIMVSELVELKNYHKALYVLEEGIRLAQAKNHPGSEDLWLLTELEIYQKLHDEEEIIRIATLLFCRRTRMTEQYKLLKRIVAETAWSDFYNHLMEEAGIPDPDGWFEEEVADICVAEQDDERLFFMLTHLSDNKTEIWMRYSHHLQGSYSEKMAHHFRKLVLKYAELCRNVNQYTDLASILRYMQKLQNGYTVVDSTVRDLRYLYKNKRSFLRVLQTF